MLKILVYWPHFRVCCILFNQWVFLTVRAYIFYIIYIIYIFILGLYFLVCCYPMEGVCSATLNNNLLKLLTFLHEEINILVWIVMLLCMAIYTAAYLQNCWEKLPFSFFAAKGIYLFSFIVVLKFVVNFRYSVSNDIQINPQLLLDYYKC